MVGWKITSIKSSFDSNLIINTMGYIKEPAGIDFTVDPTPLTNEDRKKLSEIIAYYKATGQKMPLKKPATRTRLTTKSKNVIE